MWDGSNDYSAGLNDSSLTRKNVATPQKSSNAGTENIAPYCDLRDRSRAEFLRIGLFHYKVDLTTSLPLIISQTYMEKCLGNSRAPLSKFQRTLIRLHIALRSGAFFPMAAAILLAFGMLTSKDFAKTHHFGNSRPAALLQEWH